MNSTDTCLSGSSGSRLWDGSEKQTGVHTEC